MSITDLRQFLKTVITAEEGYFCLALRSTTGSGQWFEEWHRWPTDLDTLVLRIELLKNNHNVYFSSYLFRAPQSTKDNIVPSRTIQADLDEANINALPLIPTVLVESSPGRHQAFWVLAPDNVGNGALDPEVHEVLSRKLTYAIEKCDRSGWPLGRKVRIPFTLNFKYLDGPKTVKIVSESDKRYTPSDLELLPDAPKALIDSYDEDFINDPRSGGPEIGPQELLATVKDKLPAKVVNTYNVRAKDRSAALWALLCACFRAGLDRSQTFTLGRGTENNKFADLRYNGDRELAKDVLRAEQLVRSGSVDERSAILNARKVPGLAAERRQHILSLVLQFMRDSGTFLVTHSDNIWYISTESGRPISISARSEWLDALLDLRFGLNATEHEQSYVVAGLNAYARSLPHSAVQASLSHYDPDSHIMLLHGGRKDVVRITPTAIDTVADGAYNVIFPWAQSHDQWVINLNGLHGPSEAAGGSGAAVVGDWSDILFKDHLDNVIGLEPDQARVLLKVWFMFLLFRNIAVSRPLLALFGQPGSGKTTILRKVYALLYGRHKSIGSVTKPDDFDQASIEDALLGLDNVDTWAEWLPDRLALSAGVSDVTKRKLYTNADTFVVRRQAMVAISAHNPRFGREDVADRLLLFTFQRLGYFRSEQEMINQVLERRDRLWGAIAKDIQRVISTPMPTAAETPQFRVEDFARIGYWIARALGHGDVFRSAVQSVRRDQRTFTISEDYVLVQAIGAAVDMWEKAGTADQWRTAGQIWTICETSSLDSESLRRIYKNAVTFGKKIFSLQEALKEAFEIEWDWNKRLNTRVWRIKNKEA